MPKVNYDSLELDRELAKENKKIACKLIETAACEGISIERFFRILDLAKRMAIKNSLTNPLD